MRQFELELYSVLTSCQTAYIATAPSIQINKSFTYRGVLRTVSNRYHFHGGTPADSTHWTTLANAVTAAEKAVHMPLASGGCKIIEAVGYAGGSEIPVFTLTYTLDGTGAFASFIPMAGDSAALVRYSTADRSSKNHPIYCFNYYHGVSGGTTVPTVDNLNTAEKTALQTYANLWVAGFSDGTNTYVRSRPNGNVCTGAFVEPLVTHRDLPH